LFGRSAALADGTAIIGAPQYFGSTPGSVGVFEHVAADWHWTQTLRPSDGAVQDEFGWSVAMTGDLLVIGAKANDEQGNNAGAVYVFRHDGRRWVEEQKLAMSNPDPWDSLGWSVAIDGDVIVAGAIEDDDAATDAGAIYVYRWNGEQWVEEQKLTASDGGAGDWLGWSVAVAGDMIIGGAIQHDQPASNAGAAYVYRWDGAQWTEEDKLTPEDADGDDWMGWSIAIDGARVLIGAVASGPEFEGAAYMFRNDGGGWSQELKFVASDLPSVGCNFDANFGSAVGIDGSVVVIGAFMGESGPACDSGAAYYYEIAVCPGDVDANGTVDVVDFLGLLAAWGPNPGHPADFNCDGNVDVLDFLELLANWGPCP
jgi:hypothetical protein